MTECRKNVIDDNGRYDDGRFGRRSGAARIGSVRDRPLYLALFMSQALSLTSPAAWNSEIIVLRGMSPKCLRIRCSLHNKFVGLMGDPKAVLYHLLL